ncbi:hypothetical protein [Bradyrhizobium sp.]|uniref:hypothetical protein n=1 Tax=Bradyrhizobium sp. TaxID=376 RepID=UPI003C4A5CD0
MAARTPGHRRKIVCGAEHEIRDGARPLLLHLYDHLELSRREKKGRLVPAS